VFSEEELLGLKLTVEPNVPAGELRSIALLLGLLGGSERHADSLWAQVAAVLGVDMRCAQCFSFCGAYEKAGPHCLAGVGVSNMQHACRQFGGSLPSVKVHPINTAAAAALLQVSFRVRIGRRHRRDSKGVYPPQLDVKARCAADAGADAADGVLLAANAMLCAHAV
jgi:hypothetical protein